MGAQPFREPQQSAPSPLREFESRTEIITAASGKPGPRHFPRVPTHAIGVARERRRYPRAWLSLPLRLTRVGEKVEPIPVTLVTQNISSSGIYFLCRGRSNRGQPSSWKWRWWSVRWAWAACNCARPRTWCGRKRRTSLDGEDMPRASMISLCSVTTCSRCVIAGMEKLAG